LKILQKSSGTEAGHELHKCLVNPILTLFGAFEGRASSWIREQASIDKKLSAFVTASKRLEQRPLS